MKKSGLILLSLFVLFSQSLAHPPVKVRLQYNPGTRRLTVGLPHHVKDIEKHYISKIIVKLNGKEIISQIFSVQSSLKTHQAGYFVPSAKPGDVFEVTATCNQYGKKKGKLLIGKEAGQ